MIVKATLKKPWKSSRGKVYPAGTVFILEEKFPGTKSSLYSFKTPGTLSGLVVIPDKVFLQLTLEEKKVKESQKKAYEDHMKKYKSRFI